MKLALLTLFLSACTGAIPLRTTPRPSGPAPATSAVVVFAQGQSNVPISTDQGAPPFGFEVLDPSGALLGKTDVNGWFAIEVPPGHQRFVAVPTLGYVGCGDEVDGEVGVIDADLRAGRYYYVYVRHSTYGASDVAANDGCCATRGRVELVAARVLSDPYYVTRSIVRSGRAFATAPRGIVHPRANEIDREARRRASSSCFDPHVSTLRPEDGFDLPIDLASP